MVEDSTTREARNIALARGSVSVAVAGFPTVLPPIYLRPCPRRGLFLLAASIASARALYVRTPTFMFSVVSSLPREGSIHYFSGIFVVESSF